MSYSAFTRHPNHMVRELLLHCVCQNAEGLLQWEFSTAQYSAHPVCRLGSMCSRTKARVRKNCNPVCSLKKHEFTTVILRWTAVKRKSTIGEQPDRIGSSNSDNERHEKAPQSLG
jgi:hypothetical protein